MRPVLPFLLPWTIFSCQPLKLPPGPDFQSIARGESGLPNVYFFIKRFHNSKFRHDPFARMQKTTIKQRQTPAPQQSEAALESWTVESVSHRLYAYTILVGITREAGLETVLEYEVIAMEVEARP
jgi:hypothetical protein